MEYLHHRLQRCQGIAESEETPIKGVNRRLGLYMDKMRHSFLPPTRHGELIMIYSSPHLNPHLHTPKISVLPINLDLLLPIQSLRGGNTWTRDTRSQIRTHVLTVEHKVLFEMIGALGEWSRFLLLVRGHTASIQQTRYYFFFPIREMVACSF